MEEKPLVSVIIPTYNRNKELESALESVLNQSYQKIEIIVVDDSPENELPEWIKENNKIQVIENEENLGGSVSRNKGIRRSNGELIAFLDDDDFFHEAKIKRQAEVMSESSEQVLASITGHIFYSSENDFKQENGKKIIETEEDLLYRILSGSDVRIGGSSSLMVRADWLHEENGFDLRFPRHQDWELLVRILEDGEIKCIPEVLFSKIGYTDTDPKTLKEAKSLYLRKYRDNIRSFSEERRNKIYVRHYSFLSQKFFENDQPFWGLLVFLKTLKYVGPSDKVRYDKWPPKIYDKSRTEF